MKSGAVFCVRLMLGVLSMTSVASQAAPKAAKASPQKAVAATAKVSKGAVAKGDCASGMQQWGGACYSPCKSGYRVYDRLGGDRCYPGCPAGFADDATHCRKGKAYEVGTRGFPWQLGDPAFRLEKAKERCEKREKAKCAIKGGLAYPTCKDGFVDQGLVCSPKCPAGMKDIVTSCEKPFEIRKMDRTEGAKKAGEAIVNVLQAVGETLCGPPCFIAKIIDVMSNEKKRKEWTGKVEGAMVTMAAAFKRTLLDLEPKDMGKAARTFFFDTMNSLKTLLEQLQGMFLPRIAGLDELLRVPISAAISGSLLPAVLGLGTIHWGVKQLVKLLVPELIFATGNVYASVKENSKGMDGLVKMVLGAIETVVGPVVSAVVAIKQPAKMAKLQAALERALNISEKIQEMATRAIRGGSNGAGADVVLDAAWLKSPANVDKIITGLSEFATEEIWAALQKPFQKLMNVLVGAINKVLDIPRNVLVAAVGTIPFVGGVLAGGLNFGLGLIVDKIDELIGGFLMDFAQQTVTGSLKEIFDDLKKKLSGRGAVADRNRRGFGAFLELAESALGGITKKLNAAKAALAKK